MTFSTEKTLDYRCFLLGIILCWMFDVVWASFATCFFALESVLNPIAVVVGKSILYLLVFYLLFHKPKLLELKWGHIAIVIGFLVLMDVLDFFLMDRFFDLHSLADNQMDRDISNYLMRNVRMWTNLITSLLMIGFVWWRFDSEATASDTETSAIESRSFYAGILFFITFGYLLYAISVLGDELWFYVYHPILMEVIVCLLLVLASAAAICLLVNKQLVTFPLAVILAVVAVHFFINHYLGIILFEHCTPNIVTSQHGALFDNVANCCDWALPIAAFILYRKEMKQPTL
jgi:hypothetical protein